MKMLILVKRFDEDPTDEQIEAVARPLDAVWHLVDPVIAPIFDTSLEWWKYVAGSSVEAEDQARGRVRELSEALAAMEKARDDAVAMAVAARARSIAVSDPPTRTSMSHRHRCPNPVHIGDAERECTIMMCVPGIVGTVTEKECYPCHGRISAPRPVVS